ncbi:hypothetical protein [Deinococcus apachensis]|uniref:hypothetical protein n=1 Tax=Deinococcus apachensis TaxID=309886 RepID=UPI00036170B4|nr:hypothetical protein [Deinococcus apachensis]
MNLLNSSPASRWYVLRVWFEQDGSRRVWRASLRLNEKRLHFSSPDLLLAYLDREVLHDGERT